MTGLVVDVRSSGGSATWPVLLQTYRGQKTDRKIRSERNRHLTGQLPSRQLHDAGAGQCGQRGNQQKHGKRCDADPNSGSGQEFNIAQPDALHLSESEIQPSQQPEDGADGRALADGSQASTWTTDDHGL